MNDNVHRLASYGDVSRSTREALEAMGESIAVAIGAAKDAGVAQGLIVALLHGYAHQETATMMEGD